MDSQSALKLVESAYETSTSWVERNLRAEWEKNDKQFRSEHPPGSKYHSDSYKFRSKLFRPKTRSAIQAAEADCAFAFFSTAQLVDVMPVDDNNPAQLASSKINQALLQYRLTQSIPWFKLCVGAYQSGQKHNAIIAHACWDYRGKYTDTGYVVLKDEPHVELVPPENIRIDPCSDWTDPIQKSPYLIHIIPMYVKDVLKMMDDGNVKTREAPWKRYDIKEIQAAQHELDQIKTDKKEEFEDEKQKPETLRAYDTVYVLRNFFSDGDEDWVFYTLGTKLLLSEPVLARERYWHLRPGERPYVMGHVMVEEGETFPRSPTALVREPQRELNEFTNARLDNIKLAINGRYLVRRNANIDYKALRMNIPGAGVLTDRPTEDVHLLETKDVTASSYQEQDRLNVEFDEIAGTFSPGSVQTNRALSETVGGMRLVSNSASKIGDYRILTFATTFVAPLFGQLVRLEQKYETDMVIISMAAQKAKLFQKFGIDQVTDELLRQELTTRVNVGISSTDPTNKIQRFAYGMNILSSTFGPEMVAQLVKPEEVIPELFGLLGWMDGTRFFRNFETGDDPRIPQLMQTIQQLQQMIQTKQVEEQGRNARMQELQDKKTQENLIREEMKGQYALEQERLRQTGSLFTTAMSAERGNGE